MYVRYRAGNLQVDGKFCEWDGVSTCHTMIIYVSRGNLYSVYESAELLGFCKGYSNVVIYDSGNLKITNTSDTTCEYTYLTY